MNPYPHTRKPPFSFLHPGWKAGPLEQWFSTWWGGGEAEAILTPGTFGNVWRHLCPDLGAATGT